MNSVVQLAKKIPVEATIWIGALIALAWLDPRADHISLCPFANAGFKFCPGCGLGRSISFFFHGEIRQSFAAHPLGFFAVIVLSLRTYQILKTYNGYGKSNRLPT